MNSAPAKYPSAVSRLAAIQAFRARHQKKEIALFLLGGFTFDVLTLGRIDDATTLVQQAGYLVVIGALLALEEKWRIAPPQKPSWFPTLWAFREDVLHFFFGCLLSLYAIFYFKSASGITSTLFLVFLFALLVANELPRFRHLGPLLRMTLYSFCLTSFFAYLIPVVVGSIGTAQFVGAAILAFLPSVLFYRWLKRWTGDTRTALNRAIAPAILVQTTLLGLYFAHAIPPVPLSVQEIGVYHDIERDAATWRLVFRPAERFWQRPDRHFLARPGDRIHLFARIFAPRRFRDKVVVRFLKKEGDRWTRQDAIPFVVVGGRDRGFRGFARKAHYSPGKWLVAIETTDGRVIGTLHFRIVEDLTTDERTFAMRDSDPTAGPFVGAQVLAPEPKKPVSEDAPPEEETPRPEDTASGEGDEVRSEDAGGDGGDEEGAGDADVPKSEDAPVEPPPEDTPRDAPADTPTPAPEAEATPPGG